MTVPEKVVNEITERLELSDEEKQKFLEIQCCILAQQCTAMLIDCPDITHNQKWELDEDEHEETVKFQELLSSSSKKVVEATKEYLIAQLHEFRESKK